MHQPPVRVGPVLPPRASPSAPRPTAKKLTDFEFIDPANTLAFQSKLWTEWSDLVNKKEWAFTFNKRRTQSYVTGARAEGVGDDETWHVAIAPVPSASYALALVVPDSDIQAPAIRVSASIAAAIGVNIGVFVGLCVAGFFVFVYILNFVSKAVVRPVESLKQVIDLIIRDLSRAKNDAADKPSRSNSKSRFRLNINDLIRVEDEMCQEVHMMKDSFEYMIQALRFGSSAFAKNDFDAAEKVYGDALTMYKTLNNRKGEGIVTFNLGATSHRRWLVSDKTDARLFTPCRKILHVQHRHRPRAVAAAPQLEHGVGERRFGERIHVHRHRNDRSRRGREPKQCRCCRPDCCGRRSRLCRTRHCRPPLGAPLPAGPALLGRRHGRCRQGRQAAAGGGAALGRQNEQRTF